MAQTLEELKHEIRERFNGALVFGDGAQGARLMLIGEAPGEKEELEGRPFVGKAGKNLDEFLLISGIEREKVYITNAVKLRPFAIGKSGGKINRKPTDAEIEGFRPFLLSEIKIISPKLVVTLGNVPLYAVTGEKLKIGDVHGQIIKAGDVNIYPMYHPASVIYNPKLKEVYTQDVMRLGERTREHD